MKTNELTGAALDWAVAKCEGVTWMAFPGYLYQHGEGHYSSDWSQGGPIIERESMGIWMYQWNEQGEAEQGWYAEDKDGDHVQTGPTPLIAAMRCYVASKLGDEVDVPEELK
jgi:hypothetical protein